MWRKFLLNLLKQTQSTPKNLPPYCVRVFADIVNTTTEHDDDDDDLKIQWAQTKVKQKRAWNSKQRWKLKIIADDYVACVSVHLCAVKVNTLHLCFLCVSAPSILWPRARNVRTFFSTVSSERASFVRFVFIFNFIIISNGTISFCSFSRAEKVFVARFEPLRAWNALNTRLLKLQLIAFFSFAMEWVNSISFRKKREAKHITTVEENTMEMINLHG